MRKDLRSGRNAKFAILMPLLLILSIALIAWGLSRPGAQAYYLRVSELDAVPINKLSQYRIAGKLVDHSVEREGLWTTFVLADGSQRLHVRTDEVLPDAFTGGAEVIITGSMTGEAFLASQVWAKCPSKFEAKRD